MPEGANFSRFGGINRLFTCFGCDAGVTMAFGTSTIARPAPSHLSGMALAAAAFALVTATDTIFKLLAAGHPAYQILLINGAFAGLPILAAALVSGGLGRLHTERPMLHITRGTVSVVSAYAAIYAYSRIPLANYYAFIFTGPLIVTAFSALFLKEHIERMRWIAIIAGFTGVLVVMNPFSADPAHHSRVLYLGRLAAFGSVLCYSVSVMMIRHMRGGESSLTFAFYGYLASTAIGGFFVLVWGGPPMHAADFVHLAVSGLCAGLSSICLMTAYHRAPVAVVAPFQYTQIIWGALAGWLIWHQVPSRHLIGGTVILAASGLYVIYREIRLPGAGRRLPPLRFGK